MGKQQHGTGEFDLENVFKRFPELDNIHSEEPRSEFCKIKYEIGLQIADQALRSREIGLKERASKVERWANPLTVGVLVAAFGLVGNFVNGFISNRNEATKLQNEEKIARVKLEIDLIKEAIKPSTEIGRANSLLFFANMKLITLDPSVTAALEKAAGTKEPVPGSSTVKTSSPMSSGAPLIALDARFKAALQFTLQWERGYSNNPADPGGAVNYGITQSRYNANRASRERPEASVEFIALEEVSDIYLATYWAPARCGELGPKTSMVQFDCAVNHGPARALQFLERVRGEKDEVKDDLGVARRLIDLRVNSFNDLVKRQPAMKHFLKGWLNRTRALKQAIGA